jgi:hypothetical protein
MLTGEGYLDATPALRRKSLNQDDYALEVSIGPHNDLIDGKK